MEVDPELKSVYLLTVPWFANKNPDSPLLAGLLLLTCPPKTSPVPMLVFEGTGLEEREARNGQEEAHGRIHHRQAQGG